MNKETKVRKPQRNALYKMLPTFKIAKYEAAKGNYWQNYIGEVGEWVEVSYFKYLWLYVCGYKVRKVS